MSTVPKEKLNQYNQTWRDRNRDKWNTYLRKYYSETRLKRREVAKKSFDKIRINLFMILGDVCNNCGFSDKRALQFDHINGGGNKEAKEFKGNSQMLRFYSKKPELAKEKLQVLCANCNWIKKHDRKEVTKRTIIYKSSAQ